MELHGLFKMYRLDGEHVFFNLPLAYQTEVL